MSEFLSYILPTNPIRWYPLNEVFPNGQNATIVLDKSGHAEHLTSDVTHPIWSTPAVGNRNSVYFNEASEPLRNQTPFTAKHIFIVAKNDGAANFSTYRGLLTGLDDSNYGVLIGNPGTPKLFDNDYETTGTYVYRKSQTAYPESNLLAPSAKFELLEVSLSVGWALDGLQIGRDRDNDARKWIGRVAEVLIYDRVLTETEIKRVNLYFDLKFGLWKLNGTTLNFPSPDLTGLPYAFFWAGNPEWEKVTTSHEYEDTGRSFNESSDNAARRWEIEIDCHASTHALSKLQTDIFDAFWNQARIAGTFNFTDKYGETHSNVQIEDYNRAHQKNTSWIQNAKFKLVQYP